MGCGSSVKKEFRRGAKKLDKETTRVIKDAKSAAAGAGVGGLTGAAIGGATMGGMGAGTGAAIGGGVGGKAMVEGQHAMEDAIDEQNRIAMEEQKRAEAERKKAEAEMLKQEKELDKRRAAEEKEMRERQVRMKRGRKDLLFADETGVSNTMLGG